MIDAEVLRKQWEEAIQQHLYHNLRRTGQEAVWAAKIERYERIAKRNNFYLPRRPLQNVM